MSYEFAKKEIGDYRITVYQDEDADDLIEDVIKEHGLQPKDAA